MKLVHIESHAFPVDPCKNDMGSVRVRTPLYVGNVQGLMENVLPVEF